MCQIVLIQPAATVKDQDGSTAGIRFGPWPAFKNLLGGRSILHLLPGFSERLIQQRLERGLTGAGLHDMLTIKKKQFTRLLPP